VPGPAPTARAALEVRGYERRLADLSAELREERIRNDAARVQLLEQVSELTAQNSALAERLGALEAERAATEGPATTPGVRNDGKRADRLRRLLDASDAYNAQIAEEIERLSRMLASSGGASTGAKQSAHAGVDDYASFGERK
jgi:DNA repair exonuclease SbcCD ATPase subunit